MTTRSEKSTIRATGFTKGQRLYCRHCGSEIEILNPTMRDPADQVLRCCGEPMAVEVGVEVNVSVEG